MRGSDGEYGDGQGLGFGEEDDSDGCDHNEEEIMLQQLRILEAFETLGLDPNNELTKKQLKRYYRLLIIKSQPDKAPPNKLSQQKTKESTQKIIEAKNILEGHIKNPDGMRAFP